MKACPSGPKHCQWYAENEAGKAIGAHRESQDKLMTEKTELATAIASHPDGVERDELQKKLDIVDSRISFHEKQGKILFRLREKGLPISIMPDYKNPPFGDSFEWPEESIDLFEEVITWTGPRWGCYTPNCRYEEDGLRRLGEKPGDWAFFYCKNGRVRYYFYRSLAGEVWEIGFYNGVLNSADKQTQ